MPNHLTKPLAALADPTRRQVFELLTTAPIAVGTLALHFPVSRPAISQHLKVLSDAGLVTVTRQGTRNFYRAKSDGLADLRAYLDGLWQDVLTSFGEAVEKDIKHD